MTKRLQINVRSNDYIDSLILESIQHSELKDKTEFVHAAVEKLAFEILGPEKIMNLRMYHLFDKKH